MPSVPPRRARSLGGPAGAREALCRQRPRTSSDLSSSGDDAADGGAALVVDCDLRMNVRGVAAGGQQRQKEKEEEEVVVEEIGSSSGLDLPTPACR